MAKEKTNIMNMCEGKILPKMLLFAMPLMASGMLQLFFNAADVVVVGRFAGEKALAAVGSNGSMVNLLTNFFMGLSVGANVLVARYFAAKQKEELEKVIHTAMFLSVISGLLLMLIGILGSRQILIWMKAPEDVLPLSALYLRIYFLGMAPMMVYNFGSAILRAVGDTKRPLYYLTFSGVVNVLLNLLFVVVFDMSVAGVAIATVISQIISAVLVVRCLMKETGDIRLDLRKLGMDKKVLLRLVQIGLPASVQGMVFSFSNVIIQSSINSFGTTVMAGNSAAMNIEGFVYVAMNTFYQASISFTSQNLGAGRYDRLNRILLNAELCVISVGIVLGCGMAIFGKPLLALYTDSPSAVLAGEERLKVIGFTYALCGMMDVVVGSLRGLGHSVMPMLVSIAGVCGTRLLWIFTAFRMAEYHTVTSLYLTYPVSWTITILAHFVCFVVVRRRLEKQLISNPLT